MQPVTAPWFRVIVGDPLVDADPFAAVRRTFAERYPPGSAARMHTRLESNGGLHCVAVAYLSSDAAELARELGGTPVAGPNLPATQKGARVLQGPT